MQTSYKIEKDEYLQGLMLGSKSPFIFRTPLYLFILLYIFLGLFSLYQTIFISSEYIELLLISVGILTFAAIYRPIIQKRQFNKYYESAIDIGLETEITITETDLELSTGTSTVNRKWSQLKGWKEDEDLFLLYVSDRTFHVIPKRVLSEIHDSEGLFRKRIKECSIPYKKMPPGSVVSSIFFLIISVILIFGLIR